MTVLDELPTTAETVPAHRLRIMSRDGDFELTWDPDIAVEVAAARTAFDEMRGSGYLGYKVEGDDREQVHRFDETLGEIVMTPPLEGG